MSEADAPKIQVLKTFKEAVQLIVTSQGLGCVDIPIGLVSSTRRCDSEARRMLGSPRASSVFTPPCREALDATEAAGIRALNLQWTGRSLSAQALGIIPKIREVDLVMTPALQAHVREVHPEVIFAAMSSAGVGLREGKKSQAGRSTRLAMLPAVWSRVAETSSFSKSIAAPDDVIDSLAALTVALKALSGAVRRLPAELEDRDDRGLAMEMLY